MSEVPSTAVTSQHRRTVMALPLLFALVSVHAQAAGQWWWQAYAPNYNGSLTLKDAAGTSVSTTLNPTVTGVKLSINAATMPPVVVIQTTAGTVYSQTFSTNGTYTVPAGVTKINVALAGASGGNYFSGRTYLAYGGRGGTRKNISIPVTPGANYGVYVGKRGSDEVNGTGGGNGCSGGGGGLYSSGGTNGANGSATTGGLGSGSGPANGSYSAAIQYAVVGISQPAVMPGGTGNAGGYSGNTNTGQGIAPGGGGSSCFHNLVACGGGAGAAALYDWGSGSNSYFNGGGGACAGLAGDDTGVPDYFSDGFVSVQWMQ